MPLTELDTVRAQYLWALHRHGGSFEDQVRDLNRVLDLLVQADHERRAVPPAPTSTRPPLHLLTERLARSA